MTSVCSFQVSLLLTWTPRYLAEVTVSRVVPWELLYADDLAVIAETEEELIKRLNEWKENVESKGMRVNMIKSRL